jgi:uncharacterized protein (TIGR02145 family)
MKKKNRIQVYLFLAIGFVLFITSSCQKDENKPPSSGTTTDIEGNVYNYLTIGTQVWMVENLKTTKYNDGTDIPNLTDDGVWFGYKTPSYCWYNNDFAYKTTYGALYNWYTVNTGKLAPIGWHVPSESEWQVLIDYMGGGEVAGGKLKETGFNHWISPNQGATNSNSFTAIPGGYRAYQGTFNSIGEYGIWWSSTKIDTLTAWGCGFTCYFSGVNSGSEDIQFGFSVRCLRD